MIKISGGGVIDGLEIKSPEVLNEVKNEKVIIASIFWKEILMKLKKIDWLKIAVYIQPSLNETVPFSIQEELNQRTINLGLFLRQQKKLLCQELTFMPGGSQILDYAFLKALVKKYCCKSYLEIGTYIGESINIMKSECERLYSITEPISDTMSMEMMLKELNLPNYSERLAYDAKITHFYANSQSFDYTNIQDEIDIFFIDGDHRYEAVYSDTKNIFDYKKEKAIVVWHDFRNTSFQYRGDVICAVRDALGERFKNVYVTDRNLCGFYLPDEYIRDFELHELRYEKDGELYTYDVVLESIGKR